MVQRWHKEHGRYPQVPIYRYLYRYLYIPIYIPTYTYIFTYMKIWARITKLHRYQMVQRWHREHDRNPQVPIYRYLWRYLYIPIYIPTYTQIFTYIKILARKAQNYTGTKWYRGGTENMAGIHRYLYTGTYIGTSIYPYIYPHIHRYLHVLKFWHEKHKITQVPKGTEVAHRWHKENGVYPWVPLYRYPYRYHLYTCHMTWHREHGRYQQVPIYRYLYRYLYTQIYTHIYIYMYIYENFSFISRGRTCDRKKVASNVITQ